MTKILPGGENPSNKIVKTDKIVGGNQMIETGRNAKGEVVKQSIFVDKNGDGKFTEDELVSVKYNDITQAGTASVEYKDTDGDGYADKELRSDWFGHKSEKELSEGRDDRMALKYGFRSEAGAPLVTNDETPKKMDIRS